jgi:hypothetical protein
MSALFRLPDNTDAGCGRIRDIISERESGSRLFRGWSLRGFGILAELNRAIGGTAS